MSVVARCVNAVVGGGLSIVLRPFRDLSPWVGLTVVSLLTVLVMLPVFRLVSDQPGIRRARSRVMAHLLELVLFRDDLVVSVTSFGQTLVANLRYLGKFVLPLVVVLGPTAVLLSHLSCWYAWRPLLPGEPALVKVRFSEAVSVMEADISLAVSDGLDLQSDGLRIPLDNEINWRLTPRVAGRHEAWVSVDGARVDTAVWAGSETPRLARRRAGRGFWARLTSPAATPIPAAVPVSAIEVVYPPRSLGAGPWQVNWLVAFCVLTLVFGLALKGPLKVTL